MTKIFDWLFWRWPRFLVIILWVIALPIRIVLILGIGFLLSEKQINSPRWERFFEFFEFDY